MKLLYTFLLTIILSCNFSTECKDNTILFGRYKLNSQVTVQNNNADTTVIPIIKKYGWDKVVLTVENGNYRFESNEEYFRKYEGSWKSIDIDGSCYVLVKQHKGSRKIPLDPFSIAIKENGKTFVLAFRK